MGVENIQVDGGGSADDLTDEQRRERGDIIDDGSIDADADDLKKIAGDEGGKKKEGAGEDDDGGGDGGGDDDAGGKKEPGPVPYGRFAEVNGELQAEREARIRLEERLAAAQPAKKDEAAQEPAPVDIKALRKEANRKLLEGDEDAAAELQEKIDAEILRQATATAEANIETRNAANAINDAAERVVEKYPFLNSKSKDANADAIEEVVVWRNHYIGQGLSPAKALVRAADKVGPTYVKADDKGDGGDAGDNPEKRRRENSITRNAQHENRQPATLGNQGKGDRSKGVTTPDVATMSDKQFKEMPDEEKRRARGDFVG